MHKRLIGVTIFGVIYIMLGLYNIVLPLVAYGSLNAIASATGYLSFLKFLPLLISPFVSISSLMCIIIGIGIVRLRYWAWYLMIAHQLITIISLPNPGFILGWQAYSPVKLSLQIGWVVFILWFFMRPHIKERFLIADKRFKLKSWYATLIILFLVMTLAIPAFAVGYKFSNSWKRKQPFFVKKPLLMKLAQVDRSALEGKSSMREIFNLSFLAPKDYILRGYEKKTGMVVLGDSTNTHKGFIMIEDHSSMDITREIYRVMQFKNTYQFEEALYSSNWGIVLSIFRRLSLSQYGDDTHIMRFDASAVKGFVKYGYRKSDDRLVYDCSVYDKRDNSMGNIVLSMKGKDFSTDDAVRMISSITISKKEDAEHYYQKGIQLLNEGDSVNAPFAFANAYYYMPQKAEYGYMLAKTLSATGNYSLNTAKRIVKEVLQLKPDYIEAKELLESLENRSLPSAETDKSKKMDHGE